MQVLTSELESWEAGQELGRSWAGELDMAKHPVPKAQLLKHSTDASSTPPSCLDKDKLAYCTHPKVVLRVWGVKELACLHTRVLESILPSLVKLPGGTCDADIDARTAVAQYWALEDAAEGATTPSIPSLFLEPLAVNPAAAQLLGAAPNASGVAGWLAQQIQFHPSVVLDQQCSSSSQAPGLSLATVCHDLATHTLRCMRATMGPLAQIAPPAALLNPCGTFNSPVVAASVAAARTIDGDAPSGPDSPQAVHHPKLALCGDGLMAAVSTAYCTVPGGALVPVLVLEHSAKGQEPAFTGHIKGQLDCQPLPEQQQQELLMSGEASLVQEGAGESALEEASLQLWARAEWDSLGTYLAPRTKILPPAAIRRHQGDPSEAFAPDRIKFCALSVPCCLVLQPSLEHALSIPPPMSRGALLAIDQWLPRALAITHRGPKPLLLPHDLHCSRSCPSLRLSAAAHHPARTHAA